MNAIVEKRREDRRPYAARVRSRQLPSYQATTVDLSSGGMQLELSEPLAPGERLMMILDLGPGHEPLRCTGVVRWCRLGRVTRAGLQFDNTPHTRQSLIIALERLQDQAHKLISSAPVCDQQESQHSSDKENTESITRHLDATLREAELQGSGITLTAEFDETKEQWLFPVGELMACSPLPATIGSLRLTPVDGLRLLYEFRDPSGTLVLAFHTPLEQNSDTQPREVSAA